MNWAELPQTIFMTLYTTVLVVVSIYGFHRYVLVWLYYRHGRKAPKLQGHFEELPHVTVQLPMYNEQFVARRIIEKVCQLDYPGDKLQIQVLDDSTDETQDIASRAVESAKQKGFDIEYIHRDHRVGYKAGALAKGLETAKGEFITIFDADFIPSKDILKRSIHYFTDPKVCTVQTRWEHINRGDSMLTRSQAIFLDGHFAIEHIARNRSKRFMNFNGTAGTWRRSAIEDAGGWRHDTLTEDLDLSYRAQLKGWKFIFLPHVTAPAELPPEMNAFKSQQFRWTKGGAQTVMKLLPRVMLSDLPLKVKIESFFHLTSFMLHGFMFMLILMLFPAMYLRSVPMEAGTFWRGAFDMSVFALATMSVAVFYAASQFELFRDWRSVFKYMPVLMAIGVGLCVSNTKAILEALFGHKSEFIRTPKYGENGKGKLANGNYTILRKSRISLVPIVEFVMGLYMSVCAIISIVFLQAVSAAPFLVIFAFGFFYVSIMSLRAQLAANPKRRLSPSPRTAELPTAENEHN